MRRPPVHRALATAFPRMIGEAARASAMGYPRRTHTSVWGHSKYAKVSLSGPDLQPPRYGGDRKTVPHNFVGRRYFAGGAHEYPARPRRSRTPGRAGTGDRKQRAFGDEAKGGGNLLSHKTSQKRRLVAVNIFWRISSIVAEIFSGSMPASISAFGITAAPATQPLSLRLQSRTCARRPSR